MWRAVQSVVMEHTMVEDHAPYFGELWEKNEKTSHCHACRVSFSPMVTRHHCRSCAWIFCCDCATLRPSKANKITLKAAEFIGSQGFGEKIPNDESLEHELRICDWCFRGETPGWKLRKKAIHFLADKKLPKTKIAALAANHRAKNDQHVDVIHQAEGALTQVASGLGFGEQDDSKGDALSLIREGFADIDYGSDRPAPRSGHFEFLNKTSEFCAVKITFMQRSEHEQDELLDSAMRPPYTTLEPGEAVSASFDPDIPENYLIVHILHGNKVPASRGMPIIKDAQKTENADLISPCASIENMEKLCSWRMYPVKHNCILKLKSSTGGFTKDSPASSAQETDVVLEPRAGNSIARVGLFNWASGVRTIRDKNSIDFDTNISSCRLALSFVS